MTPCVWPAGATRIRAGPERPGAQLSRVAGSRSGLRCGRPAATNQDAAAVLAGWAEAAALQASLFPVMVRMPRIELAPAAAAASGPLGLQVQKTDSRGSLRAFHDPPRSTRIPRRAVIARQDRLYRRSGWRPRISGDPPQRRRRNTYTGDSPRLPRRAQPAAVSQTRS